MQDSSRSLIGQTGERLRALGGFYRYTGTPGKEAGPVVWQVGGLGKQEGRAEVQEATEPPSPLHESFHLFLLPLLSYSRAACPVVLVLSSSPQPRFYRCF